MDLAPAAGDFLDPSALAIVLAGTALATLARTGLGDLWLAVRCVGGLARKGFDTDANRTAVARWVSALRERGVLGADEPLPPDEALASALNSMVRAGSFKAFENAHDLAHSQRVATKTRAADVFEQAGELAPVFGLVGTLFAMTQIPPGIGEDAGAATFGAIATAVLSSLYGVLSAHLVFLPLAAAIARRCEQEEEARDALVAWLREEAGEALSGSRSRRVARLKTVG